MEFKFSDLPTNNGDNRVYAQTINEEQQNTVVNTCDLVDIIYNHLNVEEKGDNPFEIKEVDDALDELQEEIRKPVETHIVAKLNDCIDKAVIALLEERKNAFRVGFMQGIQAVKQMAGMAGDSNAV